MDCGGPSPKIYSFENSLFVLFYSDNSNYQQIDQVIFDYGVVILKFNRVQKFNFGMPSTDTIQGHQYYKIGMNSCAFYELKDSDFIKSLQNIAKIHPNYNHSGWEKYRHYILTFHDNMFECVAESFEFIEEKTSIEDQLTPMIDSFSSFLNGKFGL